MFWNYIEIKVRLLIDVNIAMSSRRYGGISNRSRSKWRKATTLMCLIAVSLLPLPAIRRRLTVDTATKAEHNAEVRSAVLHALVDGPLDGFPRDRRGGCNEIIWRLGN